MALERIRRTNFRPETREMIDNINTVLSEYKQAQTARHIYYRFIALDLFPQSWVDEVYNLKNGLERDTKNTIKNYKKFAGVLTEARYAGLVDWDAIVDSGRNPKIPADHDNMADHLEWEVMMFRYDRWEGQTYHVEVMVEKDAMAATMWPICSKWHVALNINKGYSSASAIKDMADRLKRVGDDRVIVILYLGDHDPSGEDMPRDVQDRLTEFGVKNLLVKKIGLTMGQIKQLKPPPNPAKLTDSRAKAYIAKFGRKSWEVEALPMKQMSSLVNDAIEALCDVPMMEEVKERERALIAKTHKQLKEMK